MMIPETHPVASETLILEQLQRLADGFNAHDLDTLMTLFADDCVLEMPRGPEPCGKRHVGRQAVRAALAERFAGLPDVHYADLRHVVAGTIGVSRWTVSGTAADGARVQANGCDLYTFDTSARVVNKDSYWKLVEPGAASAAPAPARRC